MGKVLEPLVGTTSIDDRARAEPFLVPGNDRIEGSAPAAADKINVLDWINPRAERPKNIVHVPHIDIVVDDDRVPPQISAGVTLGRDECSLFRVARITLLD